jgi:hypothetical protein
MHFLLCLNEPKSKECLSPLPIIVFTAGPKCRDERHISASPNPSIVAATPNHEDPVYTPSTPTSNATKERKDKKYVHGRIKLTTSMQRRDYRTPKRPLANQVKERTVMEAMPKRNPRVCFSVLLIAPLQVGQENSV